MANLGSKLGRAILDVSGWTIEGQAPDVKKLVLIAAPHTSNWDFVYALACTQALGLDVRFMAKDSLFRGPKGHFFRALGGIPVDRSGRHHLVDTLAQEFTRHESLVLIVPPEGTRKGGTYWKSGFYHIARMAGVPIGLGYLDYRQKRAGFGRLLWPSGDLHADMEIIRAFYADKIGKRPEDFTRPRLPEEDTRVRAST